MYSVVIIVSMTVLYARKILRETSGVLTTTTTKKLLYEVKEVLTNTVVVIIYLCIHVPKPSCCAL